MVAGIFVIACGTVVLLIGPRWADNMANKFRQFAPEIDSSFFKLGIVVLGLAVIVLGIVEVTRALR